MAASNAQAGIGLVPILDSCNGTPHAGQPEHAAAALFDAALWPHQCLKDLPDITSGWQLGICVGETLAPIGDDGLILPPWTSHGALSSSLASTLQQEYIPPYISKIALAYCSL